LYSRRGRLEIDIPGETEVGGSGVDLGLPRTTIWRPQPFDHDEEETMK